MAERMEGRRRSLLEQTARVFDLPADVVAGVPRVELTGDGQLRMENHRGILAYGEEEICISGGAYIIKVSGQGLQLRSMNPLALLITGHIHTVSLE